LQQHLLPLFDATSSDTIFFITSATGMHNLHSVSDYINSDSEYQFGRTTGESAQDPDFKKYKSYIQDYQGFFKKIVCLTQDPHCCLMIKHNTLKKNANMQDFIDSTISLNKDMFNAQLPVPHWQLREMISFEHNAMLCRSAELYQPISHSKVINVAITDLVNHFQPTLIGLFKNLDLPMTYQDQLDRIETEWLANESFTKIDQLCHDIVTAVLEGHNISWQQHQLTLIGEAYVQCLLRNKHFEMRCHGLDTFPTNSVQLKELLYPV